MGQKCEFLGTFSGQFKFIADDFKERDIIIDNCVYYNDTEAPLSSVILSLKTGTRTIVHSNPNLPELKFEDFIKCNLSDYQWIHFEPRTPEVLKMMDHVIEYNSQQHDKITISLELEKPKHSIEFAEKADVIFISRDFCETVLGCSASGGMTEGVQKAREKIINKNSKIICAWGANGAAFCDIYETKVQICDSFPPETIIDTLGAGDTFCAAIIYALIKGKSLSDAVSFGNKIAGAKIGFYGYDKIKDIYKNFL